MKKWLVGLFTAVVLVVLGLVGSGCLESPGDGDDAGVTVPSHVTITIPEGI